MLKNPQKYNFSLKRRLFLVTFFTSLLSLIFIYKIYVLQIKNFIFYKKASSNNRLRPNILQPLRGRIFSADNVIIADNKTYYHFRVFNVNSISLGEINKFNKFLQLNSSYKKLKSSIKKDGFIIKNVSWENIVLYHKYQYLFPNIVLISSPQRFYPNNLFSHIVGYVGVPKNDTFFNITGISNLELFLNDTLQGELGRSILEVDVKGKIINQNVEKNVVNGKDLILTINEKLQSIVFKILPDDKNCSACVIDKNSGNILSMVSKPNFNSQDFLEVNSSNINKYFNDVNKPLLNRVIGSQLPPGSIFKSLTSLTLLQNKNFDPNRKFLCKGFIELGKRKYFCWKHKGHGYVNLKDALIQSCDAYFFEHSKMLNIDDIYNLSLSHGFNRKFNLGLSGEITGTIPSKKWKKKIIGENWYLGDTLNASIGQGYVLTNTLQNAVHLHSILNYGNYQLPSLIKNFINTNISNSSIKKESYDLIIKALVDVVNDPKGTAYKLSLNDKNFMGGKTGTAQVFSIKEEDREEGDYKNENLSQNLMDHSLFVGFAPIDKPKYIVSVTVEHGGSGSSVAAPLSKKILKQAVSLNV